MLNKREWGVLYPSATHNRFSHSLGVYHLGISAFDNLKKNIRVRYYKDCYCFGGDESAEINNRWTIWEMLFNIACLLHDIGHTPFSHSLEVLYDMDYIEGASELKLSKSKMNVELIEKIKNNQSKKDIIEILEKKESTDNL